jgi:hypothetical protein
MPVKDPCDLGACRPAGAGAYRAVRVSGEQVRATESGTKREPCQATRAFDDFRRVGALALHVPVADVILGDHIIGLPRAGHAHPVDVLPRSLVERVEDFAGWTNRVFEMLAS